MDNQHYNPYKDESLRCTHPEEPQEFISNRQGFNDVMDYFDIVNGHKVPKDGEVVPRKFRTIFRIVVIGSLVWIFYNLVTTVVSVLINM